MPVLDHPYDAPGEWFRGNLHTHTTESDGRRDPGDVCADYAARGYDFLALSDHDVFTDPDGLSPEPSLTMIPAVEVSANGPHLLHLDAASAIEPHEDRQAAIDDIVDANGIAVLAHPNWQSSFAHWPQDVMADLEGYQGMEVFNGVIERHPGLAVATDRWDQLLSSGRRIWGFATDDSHAAWDVAQGWISVRAADCSRAAILAAIRAGRFYASTGVSITDVAVDGGRVRVETENADRIDLVSDHGLRQQTVQGSSATFHLPRQLVHRSEHTYVRVECFGPGGARAWLQPMFITDGRNDLEG